MPASVVEFQLMDVRFSDRELDGSPHAPDDEALLLADFMHDCEGVVPGAWVFTVYLFGRCMNGESICVHATGWRPSLYYTRTPGIGPDTIKEELVKLMKKSGAEYSKNDFEVQAQQRFTGSGAILDEQGLRQATSFWRVAFPNSYSYQRACYAQNRSQVDATSCIHTPHHCKPSMEAKFLVDSGLMPSAWVKAVGGVSRPTLVSLCDVEIVVQFGALSAVDRDENAPLRLLAFDIECVSDDGTFPKAANDLDTVCQVSICTWVLTSTETDKNMLITQRACAPIEGVQIESCRDENALLLAVRAAIVKSDADIVMQFNGYSFDIPYLVQRATRVPRGSETRSHVCDAFMYCGKFRFKPCKMREKPLKSAGLGANEISYIDMDGRSNFDIFLWYKTNFKEATYSLNAIARRVLDEKKEDFSYKLIKPYFNGTNEERAVLGKYCVQDSVLLRNLARKLTFVEGDLAQSRVSMVLMERLQTHGQGTKVVSQMTAACERVASTPFVLDMPMLAFDDDDTLSVRGKYEGATVVDAVTGYYKLRPVIVVDFSSLYPTVMIAHNICKSTLVKRPCDHDKPGVVAHRVSATTTHRFSTLITGLLPTMLQELLTLRKTVKKRMVDAEAELDDDSLTQARRRELKSLLVVLDSRQKAVKVSANSIYGFMGAEVCGQYPSREAAETTTAIGRKMLVESMERAAHCASSLVKTDGQSVGELKIVYGDTDSLMFTLENVFDPVDAADAGEAIASDITSMFHLRGEVAKKLEFEKCYFPWMLFSKKRYGGILWNRHRDGHVVNRGASHSGTANKRRDSCVFVQKLYDAIINPLLYERDDAKAMRMFHEHMTRLIRGDIVFDEFVITKAVRDEYKTPAVKWACFGPDVPSTAVREIPFGHILLPKLKAVMCMNGNPIKASYVVSRDEVAALKTQYSRDQLSVLIAADKSAAELGASHPGAMVFAASCPPRFRKLEETKTLDVLTTDYCVAGGCVFMPAEDALAHMRVVQKQRERDPGSEVRSGDRVPMVYINGPAGSKARDLVEDVEYAKRNNSALNIPYYVEHQIANPITLLLNVLHPAPDKLFKAYLDEYTHTRNSQTRIDAFVTGKRPISGLSTSTTIIQSITKAPARKAKRSAASSSMSTTSITRFLKPTIPEPSQ